MATIDRIVSNRNLDMDADPLDVVRDVVLPDGTSLLAEVEAVRWHHRLATGRDLAWALAIHCLDMIRSERVGRPFPEDLAPIACWLEGYGYTEPAIASVVNYVRRNGTATLCPILDGEDVEYVENLIPPSVRARAKFNGWA